MAAEAVKVIVRCRPMNEREKSLKCNNVVFMDSKSGLCQLKNPSDLKATPKSFTFDGAYYLESTTEQIYNDIGYPLVEGVTEGYNGTIFAYGQTGCGKSYSMQGVTSPASQRGIIPRAFDHIFETISVADHTKFLVHASYCEIYNEEIRDLLGKDVKAKLDLKEHPDKGVYVQGLSMHPVHNVSECERVMEKGWKNRATGATLMNSDSSRSHSIFSIHLEMITKDEQEEEHIRAGKLNLVDLAGSERQAKTGATGDRLKEATRINLSLSALGNVISALVDGKSKHIPYRDSKLTRLLQDSLGGNTKTLMVACLSPADNNYDETLSTLRYANRAKNIKNKPKINEDPKDALLREYQEEIERLKAMLSGQLVVGSHAEGSILVGKEREHRAELVMGSERREDVDTARADLEAEKERLRQEFDLKLQEIQAMYEEEKIGKNKLQQDMSRLRTFYDDQLASVDGQISHLPTTAEVLGEVEWSSEDISLSSTHSIPKTKVRKEAAVCEASGTSLTGLSRGREPGEEEGRAPRLEPGSLGNLQRPEGPGVNGHYQSEDSFAMEVTSVTSTDYREEGAVPASRTTTNVAGQSTQRAIHLSSSKGQSDEGVMIPDNLPPDHMDLLRSANSQTLAQMHKEAVDRLHELQMQMVGGEKADNEELKNKRLRRKEFADERQLQLANAINKMDDDQIMIRIYGDIQEEVYAKSEEVDSAHNMIQGLKQEIKDIQTEFEQDRMDYLDTIRKQERQLKLYMALVDRIHPCVRRDCNYFNLDRVKTESRWDEESNTWLLPKLSMEKTVLPNAGVMPGGRLDSKSRTYMGEQSSAATATHSDDRLRRKLEQSNDSMIDSYFQSKRASQLLSHPAPQTNNLALRKAKQQISQSHSIQVQQGRFAQLNGGGVSHQNGAGGTYQNGSTAGGQEDLTNEQRAAFVHGTTNSIPDEGLVRRPQRLESLNPQTSKKSKKKRNVLEPI